MSQEKVDINVCGVLEIFIFNPFMFGCTMGTLASANDWKF